MREDLVRLWFGAVRAAADAGEAELPEGTALSAVQKAKLRILLRQDACDLLSLVIRSTEGVAQSVANQIHEAMYSELMEDAIAGVWSDADNLELVRFLGLCSEGIGGAEEFCALFCVVAGEGQDAAALRVKSRADKSLDAFIKGRKEQLRQNAPRDDGPPPDMDEFEYIDWVITH